LQKNCIELKNCSLYNDDSAILQNISWKIKENENWALIGPNGSGKTTLLKIISGYMWPTSGEIMILGEELGKTDIRELRKKIGWVTTYLLEKIPANEKVIDVAISGKHASFGVYEKITAKDIKKAESLLEFLDAAYLKERRFNLTSQGEKQKILIARALMADPILLILDEPCTSLDMKARKTLLSSVSKICNSRKTNVIYVTHHFDEIVPEIKNVMMIKKGKMFKIGLKDKLLSNDNLDKLFN